MSLEAANECIFWKLCAAKTEFLPETIYNRPAEMAAAICLGPNSRDKLTTDECHRPTAPFLHLRNYSSQASSLLGKFWKLYMYVDEDFLQTRSFVTCVRPADIEEPAAQRRLIRQEEFFITALAGYRYASPKIKRVFPRSGEQHAATSGRVN
ncbi:hypothetical protein Bbelb_125450 [Branchiostoma belcheri]|nr:hypothetical protein Bbelb_125450 [Branchiostoma belcheri]